MSEIERAIPHSIEAESGVLGCIFLSPNECMAECVSKFKNGSEVFYDLRNQTIYEAMEKMFEAKEAIDVVTVQQHLKDQKQLDGVGGIAYLADLPDVVPSAANLSFYLNIVLEKYVLRKMILHCTEFPDVVYQHDGDLAQLVDEFEASAMSVAGSILSDTEVTVKDLVLKRIDFYEECEKRGGGLLGLSTGFPDLDRMIDGLKPAEMIVLAARPSVGKTSLAMNIAENLAIDQKIPVGIFSLEMSREALVGRMISSRSRVNERKLTGGSTNEQEKKAVFVNGVKVGQAPIFIDDTGGMTVTQLRAKARRMVQKHKIKLIVIDYMQLLRTAKRRATQREEMDEVSKGVKAMAKELHLPVIAICQLNRELEKERDRKPRVSDLRESGQIEQDADIIGMLYCTDPEALAAGKDILPVNLLIAKSRNGPCGDISLTFFKEFTRFEGGARFAPRHEELPKGWSVQSKQQEMI